MQKEHPILFSTPMVEAILAGRKVMTRRTNNLKKISLGATEIVRSEKWAKQGDWVARFKYENTIDQYEVTDVIRCPYGTVGDILWVRETWLYNDDVTIPYAYKADYNNEYQKKMKGHWKPSIHMPKAAARIWLAITDVSVERLQDISEEDAISEGIQELKARHDDGERYWINYMQIDDVFWNAKHSFHSLWENISGAQSWDDNPWVWAIEFKVLSTTGKH